MRLNIFWVFGGAAMASGSLLPAMASQERRPAGQETHNRFGIARTVSSNGEIDLTGPFFQNLGTNGRNCATCHRQDQGWGVSAEDIQRRFDRTDGKDPIFRLVDGSNSPHAAVGTVQERRKAYSMLRTKGLIRVERPIPPNAEFTLVAVDDPYHYASASGLSLFRRPLPSTNLRFISTVMWDGREVDPTTPMTIAHTPEANLAILKASLAHQAMDATSGHAQGTVLLTPAQQQGIVDFELGLTTAQVMDDEAGWLDRAGALGGPEYLQDLPFYIGINDNVNDPNGPFNASSMTLFDGWAGAHEDERASVARGEVLFDTKPITISGVKGLNDNAYFGSPASFSGTCTTCHNTPQTGNHSLAIALDIGLTNGSRRAPDMPLYTLQRILTGEQITTTDPGLALSSGKWKDIGRFKGPVLRGLGARAPYFHNGSAANLDAVLDFYTSRFGVNFTKQERKDLKAFLVTL